MKNVEKVKEEIKNLQEEIKKEYKAEVIGIFGSYARGEQTQKSDIDILVRFYKGATLFDFVGLSYFLEEKLGIKVDVVSEKAIRPELKDRILSEVINI
ncbi:nucleotidyltransferase family protein [Peptococcaceae bacterium]|nr:nucleotidyltransferase family protein [Peptococcaceae bacterium]